MFLKLIDNAPTYVDTLSKLANALADDAALLRLEQSQISLHASIAYVDNVLSTNLPLLSATSVIAICKLITITWEPPEGIADLTLNTNQYIHMNKSDHRHGYQLHQY